MTTKRVKSTPVPMLKNEAGYMDNSAQFWIGIGLKVAQFSTVISTFVDDSGIVFYLRLVPPFVLSRFVFDTFERVTSRN